uniref:RxLR effector candidate protein n=1 Tax=Hyaloperonospora arabidopsidis (strain Emoy2) TaxID=559515 RepID=M4BYI4_HYAAE|nr:RxLR effector candidate protein [Hyaloperonospora arabidopsidis Emoy2]
MNRDYQVWTGYRIATRHFNLHHAGRLDRNLCRKELGCPGNEETLAHVVWDCPYAVVLWEKLIGHWKWERPSRRRTQDFFDASASRRVVNIPAHRKALLAIRFPEAAERMWRGIWHILAKLCQTRLWADRNDAVYPTATTDITSTMTSFWTACILQLRAIAIREHRKMLSAIHYAMLYACIE